MRSDKLGSRVAWPLRGAFLATIITILALSSFGSIGVRASTSKHASASRAAASLPKAPADPWAKQDKKYKGQTVSYYGGSVGTDHTADIALAAAFTKSTGIKIKITPMPSSSSAVLSELQQVFTSGSSSIDVTRLDTVWPGTFGKYLVDLRKPLSALVPLEYPSLIKNDTVGGHLIAMPYQGDFGMLYYRPDLLKKYGYSKPPTTWTQLTAMAKKIQAGERKKNKAFWGFVFQGDSYEGLTCDALEWVDSYGGGTFITHKGKVTIDNAKAIAALKLAQSWPGTISPKDVSTYEETQTANSFLAGDAAFARNWPYMTALLKGTKVQGKVAEAPLPHGPGGKSAATVGGWQVGVSKFSKHLGAAEAWARYYASRQVQIWRAVNAGIVPTDPSVGSVASVKKAQPYLITVGNHTNHVVRPSTVLKGNYAMGSADIYKAVNSILTGANVNSTVSSLSSQLKALHP